MKTIKNYVETYLNTCHESLLDDDDIFLNPENDKKDIENWIKKNYSVHGNITISEIEKYEVKAFAGNVLKNSNNISVPIGVLTHLPYDSKRKTMSRYVRDRLGNNNIVEQSNGESALMFWEREIKEDSIYILDEPENSLSAENQLKLKKFIEESTRFYNCQFIISTHSPFLLNLLEAKIYDLDEDGVPSKDWTELPNVKIYYNFFKKHANEFKKND